MSDKAVILAGVRTPIGAMAGTLASVSAPQLGAACIKASDALVLAFPAGRSTK